MYGQNSQQIIAYNNVENRKGREPNELKDTIKISLYNVENAICLLVTVCNKTGEERKGVKESLFNFFLAEFRSRICWVSKQTVSRVQSVSKRILKVRND